MWRTLRALGVGAAAAAVTSVVAPGSGVAFIVFLGLAKVLGRHAVLAFFLITMAAYIMRPEPDHGDTSLTHGAARVVSFSLAPGVADWPVLPIDDSVHHEGYGFFVNYLRPRGKDHDDVAVSIWGEGTTEDPFGITLMPRDGPEVFAKDGDGCTFDLLAADPELAFGGTVRCDRMRADGWDSQRAVQLEVRFTASP